MLLKSIDNVPTERVTEEVQDVIQDLGQVDSKDWKYTWNGDDINRLYNLNNACKNLPVPSNWFWAADAEMMIVSRAFSIKNEWNFA